MRPRVLALAALTASAAVALLAGCSGKPENSPVIRKKLAELDEMKASVTEMANTVRSTSADVRMLSDQISEIRALTPDATGAIEAVRRIEAIENRLAVMERGRSSSTTTSTGNNTPSQPAPSTTTAVEVAAAPASAPAPAAAALRPAADRPVDQATLAVPPAVPVAKNIVADAPAGANTAPASSAKPAAPVVRTSTQADAPTPPHETTRSASRQNQPAAQRQAAPAKPATSAPRGIYHRVKAGETLASIASAHKTTVAAILKENRLPSGASVLPGQNLFIPKAN